MREETRRRLDRALWRDRLQKVGIAAAVMAVLIAVIVLTDLDTAVEDRRVPGVVEHIGVLNSKNTAAAVTVDVKLDDGRHVTVIALKTSEPHVGDHVTVAEHRHGTGRVTFTWR
jgi:hypothetical protein